MSRLGETASVGQLVVDRPEPRRVLEQFGIDYCCGGEKPLKKACEERGLDPRAVLEALRAADMQPSATDDQDWLRAPLRELVDHIVTTHHAYLHRELPRLADLAEKVEETHRTRHPELSAFVDVFGALCDELENHMAKEEHVLFPMLKALESGKQSAMIHCGSIQNPIFVMEQEHVAAAAMSKLRDLTNNFAVPSDACPAYTTLF